MLTSVKNLMSYHVNAVNDELGHIKDVLFDDKQWTIRYLSVDTRRWMPLSEKVLITPIAIDQIDNEKECINLILDKDTISRCPPLSSHKPISQEYEETLFDFFGYGYYWNGLGLWGNFESPEPLKIQQDQPLNDDNGSEASTEDTPGDYKLLSAKEINHYDVVEMDGMKGHIHDFILDQKDYSIAYLVIDTRNWLPGGKKVLISPHFVEELNWKNQATYCNLTVADFEKLPEFDEELLIDDDAVNSVNQGLEQLLTSKVEASNN